MFEADGSAAQNDKMRVNTWPMNFKATVIPHMDILTDNYIIYVGYEKVQSVETFSILIYEDNRPE